MTTNLINISINVPLNLSDLSFDATIFDHVRQEEYDFLFAEYAECMNNTALNPRYMTVQRLKTSVENMYNHCGNFSNYRITCSTTPTHYTRTIMKKCKSIFHPQCRSAYLKTQAKKIAFRINYNHPKLAHIVCRNPSVTETVFKKQIEAIAKQWYLERFPLAQTNKFVLGIVVIRHDFSDANPLLPDPHYHVIVSTSFFRELKDKTLSPRPEALNELMTRAGDYTFFEEYLPSKIPNIVVNMVDSNEIELTQFIFNLLKKPLDRMSSIKISETKDLIQYIIDEHEYVVPIRAFVKCFLYYHAYEKTARCYGLFSDKMYLMYRQKYLPNLPLHQNPIKNNKLRPFVRELVAIIDEKQPADIRKRPPTTYTPETGWVLNPITEKHIRKEIKRILRTVYCPICGSACISEKIPEQPP